MIKLVVMIYKESVVSGTEVHFANPPGLIKIYPFVTCSMSFKKKGSRVCWNCHTFIKKHRGISLETSRKTQSVYEIKSSWWELCKYRYPEVLHLCCHGLIRGKTGTLGRTLQGTRVSICSDSKPLWSFESNACVFIIDIHGKQHPRCSYRSWGSPTQRGWIIIQRAIWATSKHPGL